jgi:hypothetical protein
MSYHNGSVWPHDTAMAAAGMARYGERRAVSMLLGEIYASATHFHLRLPELFCGFERLPGEGADRLSGRLPAAGLGGGIGVPDAAVGAGHQHRCGRGDGRPSTIRSCPPGSTG